MWCNYVNINQIPFSYFSSVLYLCFVSLIFVFSFSRQTTIPYCCFLLSCFCYSAHAIILCTKNKVSLAKVQAVSNINSDDYIMMVLVWSYEMQQKSKNISKCKWNHKTLSSCCCCRYSCLFLIHLLWQWIQLVRSLSI